MTEIDDLIHDILWCCTIVTELVTQRDDGVMVSYFSYNSVMKKMHPLSSRITINGVSLLFFTASLGFIYRISLNYLYLLLKLRRNCF